MIGTSAAFINSPLFKLSAQCLVKSVIRYVPEQFHSELPRERKMLLKCDVFIWLPNFEAGRGPMLRVFGDHFVSV